jgi:hypothetical protein
VTCHKDEKQNREDDVVYRNETKRRETEKTVFSGGRTVFWCLSTIYVVFGGVWGLYNFLFANKRESCTYNSAYDLRREKTTKNTLNIMFFG